MSSRPLSRAEVVADAAVHGVGLLLALAGTVVLLALTARNGAAADIAVAAVYGGGLIAMLTASSAYNLWPPTPTKRLLRRFDHSAIFLLIAATYTPFLSRLPMEEGAGPMLWVLIWGTALLGIGLKCVVPGRFDRLAVGLYLALGWSGTLALPDLTTHLPPAALHLILAGGIVYSLGVVFHLWERLKFQTAIWHAFVVTGAALHYGAVVDCLIVQPLA